MTNALEIARPADTLRDLLQLNALEARARFNSPATTKQVGLVAGWLDKRLEGTKQERHALRMQIYGYLFNRPFVSGRCLAAYETYVLLEWMAKTPPEVLGAEVRGILEALE